MAAQKKIRKLSVRVPKAMIDFMDSNKAQFKNRSQFTNQACDFFVEHLETLKSFQGRLGRRHGSSWNESRLHEKLKHLGWSLLEGMGCNSINYEFPILLEGKRVRLDVYGVLKTGEKIAVECWVSNKSKENKFRLIEKHFKQVITLTLEDLIEYYEDLIYWYETTLNNLSSQLNIPITRRRPEKSANFVLETTQGHRLYRVNDQQFIPRYTHIPYDEMIPILKRGENTFIEDLAGKKFNNTTILRAARKLTGMVGKPVVARKGFLKIENGANLEGYLFSVERQVSRLPKGKSF